MRRASSHPSRRLSPSRARDQPRDGDHRVDVESDAEPLVARAFTAASPLARRDDADRWRTRNPSERTALLAPSALARALDRRIDAILEDSSTRTRLVGARRRCRILARRARPDARALVVLLSQSIESCDRRRRGGLRAVEGLVRRARRRARRLRDFAETNAWTARELESMGGGDVGALAAVKRRLAMRERALARALVRAVDGKGEEAEAEEEEGGSGSGSGSESESKPGPRAVARSTTYASSSSSSDDDDDEEEELMMTMDGPMRASPTPTIATQPLSDEDSDRGGGAFTSPRTKNVVEILMEMDHRRASIGTTRDEVEGAL
tara:strand:+ start:19627 stop:20592 length:966 start_codon:yes stop_codon:yes gene_type:complete